MGKRPSFIEAATDRFRYLVDDHGFAGPEVERPWDRIPAIAHVRYHRSDLIIEVIHVVGFMGENHVETRCHHKVDGGESDSIALGDNTTHTGYQLRRALDLQAQAVRNHLALTLPKAVNSTVGGPRTGYALGNFGCEFCADDQNRLYGHIDQLASDEARQMILLRCPRCGAFYENTPSGPDNTHRLQPDEASRLYPTQ